ncbi:MAG TPA: carboxypeptidase-like regulatory domain-containing protein [Myxococcota bacterium]|nr:carboxypeptidase regulatory-like domain-containing protein [Myxococcota bacterium]HNU67987.1 carboxypeptidase-like regulatory domain-containing protein [Myxococcota bacterium]HOA14131.1 carboxypeptidase-like regulatory domain-containing protein [Myxococcota bacterium]HOH77302.1 carboxypeptidase-like regulatory domain-containing protein [Myxococcota bacterium]
MNRPWFPRALTIVVLAAAATGCESESAGFFTVSGTVRDRDGGPLEGISVTCDDMKGTAVSDVDGNFDLKCVLPERQLPEDPAPLAVVMFQGGGFAPSAKTVMPVEDIRIGMEVIMEKRASSHDVSIPAGNVSVPVLVETMGLSFRKDALLDETGIPVAGTASFKAASWDISLPVEMDEGTNKIITDAINPPLNRQAVVPGDGTWLRPLAAGWLDTAPASINPNVGIDLQMFSQFADDALGRQISDPEDSRIFFLDTTTGLMKEIDDATLIAQNQVGTKVIDPGLWVWMAPHAQHACFDVTVNKGDNPVNGAQVKAFEMFGDDREKSLDEAIGSEDGHYCLRAVQGKSVQIEVVIPGKDGLLTLSRDLMSGGTAACGDGCNPIKFEFPCEINKDCAPDAECLEGECVARD